MSVPMQQPVRLAPVRSYGRNAPSRPAAPPQPQMDPMQQMLEYLYQQLKERYPGVAENDLRAAAQKLLMQIRQQQSEEFNSLFFPERLQQPASPQPTMPAPPPQQGMVAQNEQRPWKHSPGAPGGIEFTDTPEYKAKMDEARRRQIQQEQEAAAKNAPVTRPPNWMPPPPGFRPGQAQPVQPPSQGTPYGSSPDGYGTPPERRGQSRTTEFRDVDMDGVDDRDQDGPGLPKYPVPRWLPNGAPAPGSPGNLAPRGPNGARWQY